MGCTTLPIVFIAIVILCVGGSSASECRGSDCYETSCTGNCDRCPSGRCCDGSKCNICHGNVCCEAISCNTCFRKCRTACQRSRCYDICYNNCLAGNTDCPFDTEECRSKNNDNELKIIVNPPSSKKRFNVTTHINITNMVNNTNEIEAPILINGTNFNNLDLNYTLPPAKMDGSKCCYVFYPQKCIQAQGGLICHRKQRWECSNVCKDAYVNSIRQPMVPLQVSALQMHPGIQSLPNQANMFALPQYPNFMSQHPAPGFNPFERFPYALQPGMMPPGVLQHDFSNKGIVPPIFDPRIHHEYNHNPHAAHNIHVLRPLKPAATSRYYNKNRNHADTKPMKVLIPIGTKDELKMTKTY